MTIAVFPGSFDPVTNGHLDVIERASKLFDKIIVAIAVNGSKASLFTTEEREFFLNLACQDKRLLNVEVTSFEGLLVDAVKKMECNVVIRGLRAVSDFEFEFQMALMNREISEKCETMFLMPSPEYSFVSSRMIKEIAKFGGDISSFVPPVVHRALTEVRKTIKSQ